MMRAIHVGVRCATVALIMAGGAARADDPPPSAATQQAIPGRPEYRTSWFHNIFMGAGYRKIWTTSIEFPVLDLAGFAGGLTPVRQVGSMQSIGLALQGRDGRSYTFRTTDKDPTRILPPEWADTVPAKLFQDATVANHPGVGFVVPPLAEVAGVLHTTPRYVFMPDTAALGEFRKTFGGKPGTLEDYPQGAADGGPGFAGAEEIVSTAEVWKRSLQGDVTRVDARALLRARMLDLFLQDWDRHNKQWRWLRIPGVDGWQPLPEDRDQVFSKFDGLLLAAARGTHPKFMKFSPDIENLAAQYVVDGEMTGGFALVAWPVHYDACGVMTFIVNQDGVAYEKDLGPDTPAAVEKITRFDPDKTWRKAQAGGS